MGYFSAIRRICIPSHGVNARLAAFIDTGGEIFFTGLSMASPRGAFLDWEPFPDRTSGNPNEE
jgi:hypothetical protein